MNTDETKMENGRSGKRGLAVVGAALLLTACTETQPQLAKVSSEPRKQTRTTTEQDRRIEGLPEKPFDSRAWLPVGATNIFQGGDKNDETQPALSSPESERAGSISSKTPGQGTRPTTLEGASVGRVPSPGGVRAEQPGAANETTDNARELILSGDLFDVTLLLGVLLVFCVLFPATIPIAGRFLGWIVSRMPGLAGWAGVVSVKAFDAVVQAIEETKRRSPIEGRSAIEANGSAAEIGGPSRPLENQSAVAAPTVLASGRDLMNEDSRRRSAADFVNALELNLSCCMDAAHKKLVRARRRVLGE
jgi:hypothetical protein